MSSTRRTFIQTLSAGAPALLWIGCGPEGASGAGGAFPAEQPSRALFPAPLDGAEAGINPPGFAWWRAGNASRYNLVIRDAAGKKVYEAASLADPVHLPARVLPPGEYTWDVEACDGAGKVTAQRGAWKFRLPAGVPELPWEDPAALLARVPDRHPRYIFMAADLAALRQSLKSSRRNSWEALKTAADRAIKLPLPKPPEYHNFDGAARKRMGYTVYFRDFRRYIDQGMSQLALAYVLGGDEKYGAAAKKILLEVERWGIEGPMSLLSPFGDEPGLSMARHGQRAYDWLYDLFDDAERERVRNMSIARARQILERLREKANYLTLPAESHNGRLIAYLGEYAVTLKGEAPDAAEWLDYSLRALTTFYPHWGGFDGGWAEGISYAIAYNTIYTPALEVLRAAAGFDLYKRPFFRNVRKFFLYCTSPIGEIKPFGDGAERGGPGGQGAALLAHQGRRFQDGTAIWWAQQAREGGEFSADLTDFMAQDTVEPRAPADLPGAAVFRGVGWAGLHSALDRPREDTFMVFKSSPYGSVSHSHADQNSFAILKGGRALAIPSGHYGPAYGMPHHAEWTRQTKANNCVLVDGKGQIVRAATASGRIQEFRHQSALTYVCGDAAASYGGKVTRFLRHVLFLRPGVFVVLDDLAAPAPARFQWLLHSFERMSVDEEQRRVVSSRKGASLAVRLECDAGLEFRQTDLFDTPFNTGNPAEYQEQRPNHWHFTAQTREKAAEVMIASAMIVRDREESLTSEWKQHPGWLGVALETAGGKGEAWVQISRSAPGPKGITAEIETGKARLAALWRPGAGRRHEVMVVA